MQQAARSCGLPSARHLAPACRALSAPLRAFTLASGSCTFRFSVRLSRHAHKPFTPAAEQPATPRHVRMQAHPQISSGAPVVRPVTLPAFIQSHAANETQLNAQHMVTIFNAVAAATKELAERIARAGIDEQLGAPGGSAATNASGDTQKPLDVIANEAFKSHLAATGLIGVMASEEDDAATAVNTPSASYAAVFDPLDGSRNIEVSIPTGAIFGFYGLQAGADPAASVLQPGRRQLAAGYALFSSATLLVLTLGRGTHGFTLDPRSGEFVLTHPNIGIPSRGQLYSLNDGRYHDWPAGLQRYIDDIRQGKGRSGKQYSARYVCSLVADFHRTLLYGGWCANPRAHLRLVYEANPLAMLAEQAGGAGSDGVRPILDIVPSKLHARLPLFLGSPEDIEELCSYGDVQQLGGKTYTV